jgi:hypothetical protein
MSRIREMWRVSIGLGILMTTSVLLFISTPVFAAVEGSALSLAEQVDQLGQTCQNGESLTVEQLQEVIIRCDTLSETVRKSDHPQKKLFVIRLNKTRDLCLYLQQLQQRK